MQRLMLCVVLLTVIFTPVIGMPQGGELSQRIAELSDKLASATEGQVLSLQGDTAYIDLGQKDGIVEGNRFELVRLGQPLMVGSRVLGHEEKIIGEVEILRVRKDISIGKIITKETEIQKGDKVYQLKKKVHRVAVSEFPYGDALNDFTRNLQDLLYTNLIQKGMSVVEREKLEEVLREQKIAYAGIIDLATAAQVGKLLGVEGVVVGSVAELGNSVAITARLVDVEKGTSMTAARVELPKTTEMGTLLGRGSRGMTAKAPAEPSSPGGRPEVVAGTTPPLAAPPPDATKPVKLQEFPKVRVEVEGLQIGSAGTGIVFLNYINKTQEELNIMLSTPQEKTFLIDDTGNRYAYSSSSGLPGFYSGVVWYGQPMLLAPGTRATVSLTFFTRKEIGRLFTFNSEQALVKETGGKRDVRVFNIFIRNIEAR